MRVEKVECPKCNGRMEPGFVMDTTHGGSIQSQWIEGQPDRSWFTGLKLKGKRRIPIASSRCTRCGFLEFWATGLA